jgi:Uma2 family endonuclease
VAQPDLLFVRAERRGIIGHDAVGGAPDLVVEILSPGTEARDRGYKKSLYARFGVAEYWIVDPKAQAIEVHAPGTDGYARKGLYRSGDRFASPLFPGLMLPLDEVFEAE